MIKKLVLTFFMVSAAFIAQASAQTETEPQISPEKQAAIKELVSIVNADDKSADLMNLFMTQMDSMREATIKMILDERTDLTAAERKAIEDVLIADKKESTKRFQEKLVQKLNFTEMIKEISVIVYDKYFTLEEIKDLVAFYKTPTGQKALKTMTPLMADTMQLTAERLVPKIPGIMKEIENEQKQEIEQVVNAKKPRPKKPASK
jgi:hypothetical protein